MNRNGQTGATLLELLAVLAVLSVGLAITAVGSLTRISREEMRGTTYDVYAHMQLARVEAVTRGAQCIQTRGQKFARVVRDDDDC